MKPDDLSELKGKIEGLKKKAGELDTRIGGPDREIDRLKRQQGERKGDIVNKLRGDGSVRKEWEQARNQEDPRPPSSGGSSLQVAWLRETHDKSNFLLVRIPIEIANSFRGQKSFSISKRYLPSSLPVSQAAIARLQQHSLIRELQPTPEKRPTIDYEALRQTYRQLLQTGAFPSHAELARHLGISRVWVSRVLKGIKKKTR